MNDKRSIILTIRAYENSIEMPASERVTYLDAHNCVHLKIGDGQAAKYAAYAKKCKAYLRFGDEVDLATCGGMHPLNQIKVCDTPIILRKAGFEQKPMLYTQRHLMDALHPKSSENYHWHGLTVEKIKRLPALLEDPVMLSNSPSRKDVLLCVLAEVDADKLPLIVAIKPDGRGNYELKEIETNFILTVYGKDDFSKYFIERITRDRIIYFNEKQGHKLETLAELQLFRCHLVTHDLDSIIIQRPECLVNTKAAAQNRCKRTDIVQSAQAAHDALVTDAYADSMTRNNRER